MFSVKLVCLCVCVCVLFWELDRQSRLQLICSISPFPTQVDHRAPLPALDKGLWFHMKVWMVTVLNIPLRNAFD